MQAGGREECRQAMMKKDKSPLTGKPMVDQSLRKNNNLEEAFVVQRVAWPEAHETAHPVRCRKFAAAPNASWATNEGWSLSIYKET